MLNPFCPTALSYYIIIIPFAKVVPCDFSGVIMGAAMIFFYLMLKCKCSKGTKLGPFYMNQDIQFTFSLEQT